MNRFYCFIIYISFIIPNQNSINIISFNIHGFGPLIGGINVKDKISSILDEMLNYDIIFIQENWKYDKLITDKLINYQLLFSQDKKNYFSQHSGLVLAINKSIEILDYKHILYNNCNGIIYHGNDCFSSKGFIFTRINLNNQIVDLYNTHLDAGNSLEDQKIRIEQLQYLEQFILKNSLNNSLVICGDFNMDYTDNLNMKKFQELFNLSKINWDDNYFLEKKIDYIFYRINFLHQIFEQDILIDLYNLSDHPPMSLSIYIKE